MIKTPARLTAIAVFASGILSGETVAQPAPLYRTADAQAQMTSAKAVRPLYRVVKETPLGAPDRWDYVTFDPSSGRVYVAHGDRLTVVDGRSGAVMGEVSTPNGVTHGTAVAPDVGRGFTDDGKSGTVKVFDLASLKVTATLPAALDADAIVRDPKSGHIFVVDGDSHSITVVDPATDEVLATLPAGQGLESALADDQGHVYVNGAEKLDILRVDTATNRIDAHWPIADCASPHGLAMDVQARRLFASCVNGKLVVVDADSGREVAGVPIGLGTDSAAFDPVHKRVLSANGRSGTLSVIQEDGPDRYRLVDEMTTRISARTMTVDPATGRVFLAAADVQPPTSPGARSQPVPGSLKLVILDPVK